MIEGAAELGVSGGHLAGVHLIDAVDQVERRAAAADYFAVQILAAEDSAILGGNGRQEFELLPVHGDFGLQSGELGGVGGVKHGFTFLQGGLGVLAGDAPLIELRGGLLRIRCKEIGAHDDGGLIDSVADLVERGGSA